MKQLLPSQTHKGFKALILLSMLQLTAYRAGAQEQMLNINVNGVYNNVSVSGNQQSNNRNVNTSVPTGPNGTGSVPAINMNAIVIDNGTGPNTGGPNMRGYTSSPVSNQTLSNQLSNKPKTNRPVAVQAVKPKRVVAASPTVQRPKPKPKTTVAAPRRTVARPAAPVVAAPAIATPAVPEQLQAQLPVSNPVIGTGNQFAVVEQVMNNDHNIAQSHVMSNVSSPVISTLSAPAVRSSAASGSSASSGKSQRFGRKKHGSFYYNTNKKLMKLFAKTKNRKFDPAKCFVWK